LDAPPTLSLKRNPRKNNTTRESYNVFKIIQLKQQQKLSDAREVQKKKRLGML
jgi:hypothetical protein